MRKISRYILKNGFLPRILFVGLLIYLTIGTYFGKYFWLVSHVDQVIHAVGHWIFGIFGQTMMLLGGTLMQLLFPSVLLCYFSYYRKHYFASGVMLWWLGENLARISTHMHGATERVLPLLAQGDHDWFVLFNMWGLLSHAAFIAELLWHLSIMLLLTGIMWALMYSHNFFLRKKVVPHKK